jgi:ABC transporter substrate binding protein
MGPAESDLEAQSLISITHRLEELGWSEGRNIRIEDRWTAGDNNRLRAYAAELAQLKPDVIVCEGTPVVAALQQATRTIPVVFVNANNLIGSGFVASIAWPGGKYHGLSLLRAGNGGADHRSQDREGSRSYHSTDATCPRRRGDRIRFVTSDIGTFRTQRHV